MVPKAVIKPTICVVGLGYVGYPLAEAFARHFPTIGFDIDVKKILSIFYQYLTWEGIFFNL